MVKKVVQRAMQARLGSVLKTANREVALAVYRRTLAFWPISILCWATRIILTPREIRPVYEVVRSNAPCNFLIFGLGDDSPIWAATNQDGHTLFVEDDREWIDRMLDREPDLNVHFYEYKTVRRNWEEWLDKPKELEMELPTSIRNRTWDVILVDAPSGYEPDLPGRMQSIYTAAQLAQSGTHVFVHDIHRTVEDTYSRQFLGDYDHVEDIEQLRHYKV